MDSTDARDLPCQISSDFPHAETDQACCDPEAVVSFYAELPLPLQRAMTNFIERYPNWDQYRLMQAALAGFLVQNGVETREITRLYIGNMFGSKAYIQSN